MLYEFAVFCRKLWYAFGFVKPYKSSVPVISIGNITAGGTGKTPMAIHVARILMNKGVRVAVLSRGYKRATTGNGKRVTMVSDGISLLCPVDEAGDEPYLIASRLLGSAEKPGAMVIVGKDRITSAKKAVELGAQAIVLDDAFQHWRIKRDLDIVLLDAQKPFGNGWLLPAGRLREPVSAAQRADAIVLTRCPNGQLPAAATGLQSLGLPVYCTRHAAQGLSRWERGALSVAGSEEVKHKKALLFSGIARPDSFEQSVKNLGPSCGQHLRFGDHHRYNQNDLAQIKEAASLYDAIVTTEKDAVRLPTAWDPGKPVYVLRVGIEFVKDAEKFEQMILGVIKTPPQPLPAAERGRA